ncbi:hypothetical protein DPMN_088465 [Dreissena polymorpha]|uniref:Uncharacterized protein n=1 Tax=Dreissena polymorpha TaxID=45954 RepID=A0A9D4QXB3_DREPO|nr:hypothetical protein DPMN_088465 [Dreissena polymorpha]
MIFWHCNTCDICTNTRSVCEFCGHLRQDQNQCIIKPFSVFRSQVLTNGVVSTEDIKKQWLDSLSRPDDDLLTFDLPYLDNNSIETMEYNSQNAMVDQLGLLNPVGFWLRQANAECRNHRRCKGG